MNAEPEFSVAVHPNGSCTIVMLKGELDVLTAPQLAAELIPQNGAARDLLIDLSDLTFIDSSGIHVLARALKTEHVSSAHPATSAAFSTSSRSAMPPTCPQPSKRRFTPPKNGRRLTLHPRRASTTAAHQVRGMSGYRAEPRGTPDESRFALPNACRGCRCPRWSSPSR
jgi:ABC-type transporter Mla MlaB component